MVFSLLLGAYFLSGFSALTYQLLWVRQLTLAFGHTTLSVSAVLSAFMLGLTLGSGLGGRWANRISPKRAILFFAATEASLGVLSLLFRPLISRLPNFLALALSDSIPLGRLQICYFAASLGLLSPLAVLMGGTFPLLARAISDPKNAQEGGRLGWLYGVNAAGAVTGVFAVTFFLVPALGVSHSYYLAVLFNLSAALLGVVAARFGAGSAPLGVEAQSPNKSFRRLTVPASIFLLTGLGSMVLEVAWTRIFALILGSSIYAYAMMLLTFLIGLSLGGLAFAFWGGHPYVQRRALPFYFLLTCFSVLINLPFFNHLPYLYVRLFPFLAQNSLFLHLTQGILCALVMTGPTFLLGFSFPWVLSEAEKEFPAQSSPVGRLTAVNTLGCLVGSGLAGLFFVPRLGSEVSLLIGATALGMAALAALFWIEHKTRVYKFSVGVAAAICLMAGLLRPHWNPYVMASGVFLYAPQYSTLNSYDEWLRNLESNLLLFYKDGVSSNVSVFGMPGGGRFLRINGKTDASSQTDMLTQLILGYLPVLVHNSPPESALVIGLGSGVTLGALTTSASFQHLTAVEIEPVVAEAQEKFSSVNRSAIKDPRVRLVFTDARHFLNVDRGRYDLITSEPSNPWMAGVSTLYTREAFLAAKNRLNPGGVFCQWFHSYAMGERDFRMVVRTFASVFPHVLLFTTGQDDFFLVGSPDSFRLSVSEMEKKFLANPGMSADLAAVDLGHPYSFLAFTFLLDDEEIRAYSKSAPLHVDDHPVLEHSAPHFLHRGETAKIDEGLKQAKMKNVETVLVDFDPKPKEKILLLNFAAEAFLAGRRIDSAAEAVESAMTLDRNNPRTWNNFARVSTARNQQMQAEQAFRRAISLDSQTAVPWFHLGVLYKDQGFDEKSRKAFEEGLARSPHDPMGSLALAESYVQIGRREDARRIVDRALEKPIRDRSIAGELIGLRTTLAPPVENKKPPRS